MRKKGILKQAVALTLALGISLSGSLVAYAAPYLWVNIDPVTITETEEKINFKYFSLCTYENKPVIQVSDINATFKPNREKSYDIEQIVDIEYGYIENGEFISTYTESPTLNMDNLNNASYPVFDTKQVQKDLQAGITDRVYCVAFCIADTYWNGDVIPLLFRLSSTPLQNEGWVQDSTGWWYRNADGSYPVNAWKEINSKQYYFGADGYMLHDTTTPDGYTVGSDGVWIQPATVN